MKPISVTLKTCFKSSGNGKNAKKPSFKSKALEWRAQRLYVIFLPPYSPELNLIEMLWKKIKYEWLPVTAYQSFQSLTDHVLSVLSNYGERYKISFV